MPSMPGRQKTERSRMTRKEPRRPLEEESFELLCARQCPEEEICGYFGVEAEDLDKWCSRTYGRNLEECIAMFAADGKCSLRGFQLKLAESNASMATWLGKQYLKQTDRPAAGLSAAGIRAANEQLMQLADLINHPQPGRTLAEVEGGVE